MSGSQFTLPLTGTNGVQHVFVLPNVKSLRGLDFHGLAVAKEATPPDQNFEAFFVAGRGRVLFVKGAPSPVEMLRRMPFVNDEGARFERSVLQPLGLTKADVMVAWCDVKCGGEDALEAFIKNAQPDAVVSVTDEVELIKSASTWNLPTLTQLQKSGDKFTSELVRKLATIRKRLDETSNRGHTNLQLIGRAHADTEESTILAPIHKANTQKQIVFGVVLDPYQVDTQDDWCPPAEIESSAHNFMMKSRAIGLHHQEIISDAQLVESSIEQYPSASDREKAHNNEPHRVYARKYGNDVVHSGAWIIGVKLSDRLWKKYESGEIDAFSIEGMGKRIPVAGSAMPEVQFVEIGEISSGKWSRTST